MTRIRPGSNLIGSGSMRHWFEYMQGREDPCVLPLTMVVNVGGIYSVKISYNSLGQPVRRQPRHRPRKQRTAQRAAEGRQARPLGPLVNREGYGTNYPSLDSVLTQLRHTSGFRKLLNYYSNTNYWRTYQKERKIMIVLHSYQF
jgi:hypothetical protein